MIKLILALFIVTAGVPADEPFDTLTFTGPGGESVEGIFESKAKCEEYLASEDNAEQMAKVATIFKGLKAVQSCVPVEKGA